jgi:hypothetical protein
MLYYKLGMVVNGARDDMRIKQESTNLVVRARSEKCVFCVLMCLKIVSHCTIWNFIE